MASGACLGLIALAGGVGSGCSSPLDEDPATLRKSLLESVRREALEAMRHPQTIEPARPDRVGQLNLKPGVLEELERTSGIKSYRERSRTELLQPTLMNTPQKTVFVSLERVIATSVTNNLNVQFARLSVAGEQTRLVQAEANFDWVLFSNFQWSDVDQERIASQQFFPPSARSFDQRQVVETTVGLRRRLTSGGLFTVQQGLTYTQSTVNDTFAAPNPANEAALTVQLDQPLLRNFGSDTTLAEVRLAANAERDQVQQLKAELIRTVASAEQAYWRLVQAHSEYLISRRLLNLGIDVQDVFKRRRDAGMDVNPSQYANAVAAVENRRGDLIQAERSLRDASLQLKAIMNDPDLTIGNEIVLLPVDEPVDVPMQFSLIDGITTALARRPEIQRALLGLDDSSIRRRAADNQALPRLDLQMQARLNALAEGADTALSRQAEVGLVDFLVGLAFEQPIGNRAAEAFSLQRRLEQQQGVVVYRDVVTRVVGELKGALYDLQSTYLLIEQRRAARIAAAEDLRTSSERELLQALTPEQLDLKLRKQEALAAREAQEVGALTGYNTAISQVYAAMGTILERNRIRFEVPRDRSEQRKGEEQPPRDPIFGLPPAPR